MRHFRFALVASLLASIAAAQTGTGAIQGTVKDGSGAMIPSAKISLVHTQTAQRFETTTNEVGFYVAPALQTGPYKISVQAPGMQSWEGELLLQVAQTTVVDPVLKVGAAATEITVAGDVTPLVTTTSATDTAHNGSTIAGGIPSV